MASCSGLTVDCGRHGDVAVLRVHGVLDIATAGTLRDTLLKRIVDEPRAVLVDLDGMTLARSSFGNIFRTVWMRTNPWPGVPLALVCGDPAMRHQLRGVARSVPIHATTEAALAAVRAPAERLRAATELPARLQSITIARHYIADVFAQWPIELGEETIERALLVTNELVDNAICHTPVARIRVHVEWYRDLLTIAVADDDPNPAILLDPASRSGTRSGAGTAARHAFLQTLAVSSPPFRWEGGRGDAQRTAGDHFARQCGRHRGVATAVRWTSGVQCAASGERRDAVDGTEPDLKGEPAVSTRRYSFSVRRSSSASAEELFDTVADGAAWSRWAGPLVNASSWDREGDPAPGGVGAIRRVGSPPAAVREEITEYERPGRLGYRILSGAPVRDYTARVEFTPRPGGGTDIVWSGEFGEVLPFSGIAVRAVMSVMISSFATRLARHAERGESA